MVVIVWLLLGLGIWLVDSAVRNRSPIQSINSMLTTGKLDPTAPPIQQPRPDQTIAPESVAPQGQPQGFRSSGSAFTNAPASANQTPAYWQAIRPTAPEAGSVSDWIAQATTVLEQQGVPPSDINQQAIATIINGESSGHSNSINLWDSNAAAGHPSMGIMQTIPSVFAKWAVAGHTDIWDPVDNIVAATRYALARYGSLSNVPGVLATESGSKYVGY